VTNGFCYRDGRKALFGFLLLWLTLATCLSLPHGSYFIFDLFRSSPATPAILSLDQFLKARRDYGTLVIDLREKSYFLAGKIPGSRNYSAQQILKESLDKGSKLSKAQLIVLYGAKGESVLYNLSVARVLDSAIADKLCIFSGGWKEWIECGLPVETDKNPPESVFFGPDWMQIQGNSF
jgi:3-mercaptopyruvate sulfurtransferase SseA